MKEAKIFQNGQSQAVRLPKECRFSSDRVYVKKMGKVVVLIPIETPWESMFSALKKFSKDYMKSRDQPKQQERKDMFK